MHLTDHRPILEIVQINERTVYYYSRTKSVWKSDRFRVSDLVKEPDINYWNDAFSFRFAHIKISHLVLGWHT